MSTSDFFANFDEKLDKLKGEQQQASKIADENAELLEEVVTRLSNQVEEYAKQVQERNIKVELTITKVGISFTMKYKDGGHHGTRLGRSRHSNNNRLEITCNFTNDDGKNYTSTSGTTYDRSNWKDEFFIAEIQRCINDFIIYAPRHGGLYFH